MIITIEFQGFRAFYSGLIPTLMIAVPNSVLYYSSYDGIKWRLEPYFTDKRYDLYTVYIVELLGWFLQLLVV